MNNPIYLALVRRRLRSYIHSYATDQPDCWSCGFPFDSGDIVYYDPDDPQERPFCSPGCAHRADTGREQ